MPRSKQEPQLFEATVFHIGKKSSSGCIYSQEIADRIILDVVSGEVKYTVEEVAPQDRIKNNVKPYESWPKRAMAVCVGARIDDYRLIMKFQIYNTKYGKNLALLLENNPPGSIEFFPVGIGNDDKDGHLLTYKLSYVSFEVKK